MSGLHCRIFSGLASVLPAGEGGEQGLATLAQVRFFGRFRRPVVWVIAALWVDAMEFQVGVADFDGRAAAVAGRDRQPRARIGRGAVARPALGSDGERLLSGLLGELEIAEEADQGGADLTPVVAEGLGIGVPHHSCQVARDRPDQIGRAHV